MVRTFSWLLDMLVVMQMVVMQMVVMLMVLINYFRHCQSLQTLVQYDLRPVLMH